MVKNKQIGCKPKKTNDGPPISEMMPTIDHIREQREKIEKMLDGIDE